MLIKNCNARLLLNVGRKKKMDEIFEGMSYGFRVSMKDSIMMDIVHTAMNKAHEKLKCKDGIIERLIEISKFYELAVMELEGCLKIVQEETDSFALETTHEQLLSDLLILRDRLQGRLEETEITIAEKLENESKLRLALECKDREEGGGVEEELEFSKRDDDDDDDNDICELKNSVERKVQSFKQKFLVCRVESGSFNQLVVLDEEERDGCDKEKIEQMSSDIDNLKQTLDLACEKMHNAIVLSEVEPAEQLWRWTIEKETESIITKGFIRDSREVFKTTAVGFLNEYWSDLMSEIISLHCELEPFCSQINPMKKVEEVDRLEEQLGDEEDPKGVANIIKNHESIIRQKRIKETNWLQEKRCLSLSGERDDCTKRRIQQVIVRLDRLINWNAKLGETSSDYKNGYKDSNVITDDEKIGDDDSLAVFFEEADIFSALHQEIEDSNLVAMILEETYFVLYRGLMEDFYTNLYSLETENLTWKEMVHECKKKSESSMQEKSSFNDLEGAIMEDVLKVSFREMVNQWNTIIATENLVSEEMHRVMFDIYQFVIIEVVKDAYRQHYIFSANSENQNLEVSGGGEESLIQTLDSLLKCGEASTQNASHDLEECEEFDESADLFVPEEETAFSSVNSKLEKALQQLNSSKMLLSELGPSFGLMDCDLDEVHDQTTRLIDCVSDGEYAGFQQKENEEGKLNQSLFVFSPLFTDFECLIHERLGFNESRLQELKHQYDLLAELIVLERKKEMLYKKAFVRRCHNLQKAETEVDLLGDQVDVLLGLLEQIYKTLHHYSPVLQQYFGVSDVLKLIKKELTGHVTN